MKSSPHIPMETLLRQMDLWYRTPLGSCLLDAERAVLAPYIADCFGQHLLQVGGPSEQCLFASNPIGHQLRLSPEVRPLFKGSSVRGSLEQLPFLPESINMVLLPHVLEFAANPQTILTQSQLVLAPEGRLIILGFNPWSLWGLCRYTKSVAPSFPWCGRFLSLGKIRKWLLQYGFVVEQPTSLFFRPPASTSRSLERWLVLEALGRLLWADNGGVYLLVATKRVIPLIPIQEQLRYADTLS